MLPPDALAANPFDPPRPAPRPKGRRHRPFRRRRHAPLALAIALAVLGALAVAGGGPGDDAGTAAPTTGSRRVAVATRELAAGDVLDEDDLAWRVLPDGAVGPAALTEADAPVGRVVTASIDADEVVSRRRLAPDGVRGLAALVPEGSVAVAVARDEHTPPLERAQRVDVLSTAGIDPVARSSGMSDGDGEGGVEARRVATGALVIDVADDRVLLAVGDDDAPAVAAALLDGAVVLALARG